MNYNQDSFQIPEIAKMWQEKDAEIERLKLENNSLRLQAVEYRYLLTRAADALEFWMKDLASTEQQYVDAAMRDERLLAELRKAAE